MRPHELTLDGFRSYAGAQTISWEGRSLVGVVGPIGSGKSSILDAISFALYNQTPRLGSLTTALINQRREEGKVSLTFSVDGQTWRVVRALRRGGQAAHVLYRIEDGEEVQVADRAREATDRITELLGLDFRAFQRSVLLAQNQFAEFLEATPTERNEVLRGVFGFERIDGMRAAARVARDAAAAELKALERLREQAAGDREALEEAGADREAAEAEVGRLEEIREPVAGHEQAAARARATLEAVEERRRRLAAVAERIPEREATEERLRAAETARARVDAAAAEAASAAGTAAAAAAALEEAVEAAGGREALTRAASLVARHQEQVRAAEAARSAAEQAEATAGAATEAAGTAEAAAEAAAARASEAESALGSAAEESARTREALHEATHRDLAATLREGLEPGAVCPVCEQEVAGVPAGQADVGLDGARAAHEAALASEEAARKAESAASRDLAGARAAADAARTEAERADAAADAARTSARDATVTASETAEELGGLLGGTDDPAAALEERRSAIAAAEEAAGRARSAAEAAAAEEKEARARAEESRKGVEDLRARLADLAARLEADDLEITGEPDALRIALRALRDAWVAQRHGMDEEAEAAGAALEEAEKRRGDLLEGAGLERDADPAAAISAARERRAALDARVADLERRLADLARLEEEQSELVERRDRYGRLFDDLAPARFPTFVLDDRRRALAALGSERFEYLSSGRYRFTDDGEFSVVDLTAADQTRKAASLSGGETFLASLALALALAEIVAREGGRLDAFFLDEGFGSLDPEHIELAMSGIERLITEAPDRLIVVVSHVAGLRERIDDLIVLGKDAVTGDTEVRSGGSSGG